MGRVVVVLFVLPSLLALADMDSEEFLYIKARKPQCYCPPIHLLPVCSDHSCPTTSIQHHPNLKQVCSDRRLTCKSKSTEYVRIVALFPNRPVYLTRWTLHSTFVDIHCIRGGFFNDNMFSLKGAKFECLTGDLNDLFAEVAV
uniref:Uncharacterized protein n=1 Tax=Bursaphelenchus xylophilus TaxID=6326 RepID=A0A1I7S6L7_BURXY